MNIEQRLDFSDYVPDGFGTGDCVIVADRRLHIIDFKYGQGVLVEAEHNPQMMLYALGALHVYDALYDVDEVSMTIYQPRRANVSTWTISVDELRPGPRTSCGPGHSWPIRARASTARARGACSAGRQSNAGRAPRRSSAWRSTSSHSRRCSPTAR